MIYGYELTEIWEIVGLHGRPDDPRGRLCAEWLIKRSHPWGRGLYRRLRKLAIAKLAT